LLSQLQRTSLHQCGVVSRIAIPAEKERRGLHINYCFYSLIVYDASPERGHACCSELADGMRSMPCWNVGTLERWNVGTLERWNVGTNATFSCTAICVYFTDEAKTRAHLLVFALRSATPLCLAASGRGIDIGEVEIRQLIYFIAVAEEEHFSRAALRIGIEQSPLSRAIRALECDIGVLLIVRSTRGSRLTPAGELFLRHARSILESVDAATCAARAAASLPND
jgi:hypothetical protein